MFPLRVLLCIMFVTVMYYTVLVVAKEGLDLLPVFFDNVSRVNWSGQFNLDFMCMLILSGVWVAWRNRFSAGGLVLGFLAMVLGTPFLCVYLMVEMLRGANNGQALLLGVRQYR